MLRKIITDLLAGSVRYRFLVLLLVATASCASLPYPTPADAVRAQLQWPRANLATLEAGRQAYVGRCSGCHSLHLPKSRSPEEWVKALPEMEAKAKLQPGEHELITQFLQTMSSPQSAQ